MPYEFTRSQLVKNPLNSQKIPQMSPSCVSILWCCEQFIENWLGYYDAPVCFYFPITTQPNTKVIYHSLCIFFHMRSFWMQHCMKLCRNSSVPLTYGPRQNVPCFADDILKCMFLNEKFCISMLISLNFIPKGPNRPNRWQPIIWSNDDYFTEAYMRHSASMN